MQTTTTNNYYLTVIVINTKKCLSNMCVYVLLFNSFIFIMVFS